MVRPLWKTVWRVLEKLKIESHVIQQFHFWVYPQKKKKKAGSQRYLHTRVHSSTIHNSQKAEAAQVSIE